MSEPSFFPYRAFLSYSHADEAWGVWLHKGLEGFRIPRDLHGKITDAGPVPRDLRPIFRDRADFSAWPLQEQTIAVLKDSQFLVLIASPNSAKSFYVAEEIRLFSQLHGQNRVLALIVEGAPPQCFSPELPWLGGNVAGDATKDGKRRR